MAHAMRVATKIGQPSIQTFQFTTNPHDMESVPLVLTVAGRRYQICLQMHPSPPPPELPEEAAAAIGEMCDDLADHICKMYVRWVMAATCPDSYLRHTVLLYDKESRSFFPEYTNRFENERAVAAALRANMERQMQTEQYDDLPPKMKERAQTAYREATRIEDEKSNFDATAAAVECATINLKLSDMPLLHLVIINDE